MRTQLLAVAAFGLAIGLVAAQPSPGIAQSDQRVVVRGMFGDRVLRQALAPKPSTERTGIARSASGMFLGRGAANGSLMFPGMPWQYQGPEPWPPGVVPLATFLQGPLPTRPAPPQPVRPEVLPPQAMPGEWEAGPAMIPELRATPAGPDQWLRTMGGMAPVPAGVSLPAAPAATAVSSPAAPAAAPSPRSPRPMPPPIQLGFVPPRSFEDPGAAVARLIGRISQIEKRSTITVSLENETAVLRGRVATERDRLLAENIARLQPGIWGVRNELVVENPSPAAAKSSSR